MKSKINLLNPCKWLFTLSAIVLLSLFSSVVQAQVSTEETDSTARNLLIKPPQLKRSEFLALNDGDQMAFLNSPPFIITDIINTSAADFLNPLPGEIFIPEAKFYNQTLTPPLMEREMLVNPEIYKIYDTF
jgi:hypothetical protein